MNKNLLKAKMVERGKTQEEVAIEIGMSPMSLSRKLTGKREFKLSEVIKLCQCLSIEDPREIFLSTTSQIRNI